MASRRRSATRCRVNSIISLIGVPGPNAPSAPTSRKRSATSGEMIPPDEHYHVLHAALAQRLNDAGGQRDDRARQDAQPEDVRVLLEHRFGQLIRPAAQTGVDHLHARVAKPARDHLDPAIVAVKADIAHDYAYLPASGLLRSVPDRLR